MLVGFALACLLAAAVARMRDLKVSLMRMGCVWMELLMWMVRKRVGEGVEVRKCM